MSLEFERALNKCIFKLEPYSIVDGVEYYYTIPRDKNKTWNGWKLIDMFKDNFRFPDLVLDNSQMKHYVGAYYKRNYWDKLELDDIDLSIEQKTKILNTAIKYSPHAALKVLEDTQNTISYLDDKYHDEYWFNKIYDLYEGQILLKTIKSIPKKNLEILLENFI